MNVDLTKKVAKAASIPTSTKSPPLPKELVWLILKFWRTDRDP